MADAQTEIRQEGGRTTIIGGGMLDLTNSQEFNEGLRAASETAESVVVDLRPALFIDTAIVQYLATASLKMKDRGKRLQVLVAEGAYPQQVIKTVGFDQLMDVVAEPAETTER